MSQIGIPNLDKNLEASLVADMQKVEELMRSHIKGDYPLVVETSRHLVEAGGKRLRPLLTLIAAQFGSQNYSLAQVNILPEAIKNNLNFTENKGQWNDDIKFKFNSGEIVHRPNPLISNLFSNLAEKKQA